MPNRVLKESIKSSEQIDSLNWFEEVVFYRLIVSADDHGCFDGRPVYIKNALFPTKDSVTKKAIENAIQRLVSVGLLQEYEVNGMPYLFFPTWEKHQRVRNSRTKYPLPPACGNSPQVAASCGELRPESNPNPNPNPNPKKDTCAEPSQPAHAPAAAHPHFSEPSADSVISIPLNDGTVYGVSQAQIDHWAELYPAVDVMQQLRNMVGWCEANPQRRKTRNGAAKFIASWLSREQDKGGARSGNAQQVPSGSSGQTKRPAPKVTDPNVL